MDGSPAPDHGAHGLVGAGGPADRVICYIEVGAAERYLHITVPVVGRVIRARIARCAKKGFDAIEPDIDDSYTDDTGLRITETQNIAYDRAPATYAHGLGLAWGQKNGDNDRRFSKSLEHFSDFLLDEQCFQYDTCRTVAMP